MFEWVKAKKKRNLPHAHLYIHNTSLTSLSSCAALTLTELTECYTGDASTRQTETTYMAPIAPCHHKTFSCAKHSHSDRLKSTVSQLYNMDVDRLVRSLVCLFSPFHHDLILWYKINPEGKSQCYNMQLHCRHKGYNGNIYWIAHISPNNLPKAFPPIYLWK